MYYAGFSREEGPVGLKVGGGGGRVREGERELGGEMEKERY